LAVPAAVFVARRKPWIEEASNMSVTAQQAPTATAVATVHAPRLTF
jgi:hypothetical protein